VSLTADRNKHNREYQTIVKEISESGGYINPPQKNLGILWWKTDDDGDDDDDDDDDAAIVKAMLVKNIYIYIYPWYKWCLFK